MQEIFLIILAAGVLALAAGGLYAERVNAVYGDAMNPNELGSGGYGGSTSYPGGNGGGLVKIKAGTLTVDGSILADGGSAPTPTGQCISI